MRHKLLTKQWLAAHTFVAVCVVVFPMLGWWQWKTAQSPTGGMQNFGYALQWPAFAILLVAVWVKSMRDEIRPTRGGERRRRALSKEETRPVRGVSLASKHRPAAFAEEEDEALAAYNRRLARLNALHERHAVSDAREPTVTNHHRQKPASGRRSEQAIQ